MKSPRDYTPTPGDKFTFGLWTGRNPGADPFGMRMRIPPTPAEIVRRLAELGVYGVNLHENDLVQMDATAAARDRIVRKFQAAPREAIRDDPELEAWGMPGLDFEDSFGAERRPPCFMMPC
jgi:hypothetical protein